MMAVVMVEGVILMEDTMAVELVDILEMVVQLL